MYEITTGIKLICLSVCKSCQCIRLQVLSTSSALMSFPCSISVSMSWDSDAVLQISDPQHHTNGHKTYLTKQNITSPCITSDHITSHYITLRYTTLHYTKPHYTTSHYITLHCTTLHYITLHYTTLHYITRHYTTLHSCFALRYTTSRNLTLHHITWHYTTVHYIIFQYIYNSHTNKHPHTKHIHTSSAPYLSPNKATFARSEIWQWDTSSSFCRSSASLLINSAALPKKRVTHCDASR